MIIDDKLANSKPTDHIYTVKKAYEYLLSADTTHFNREILRQCSLNEYITPNLTFDQQRTQTAKEEMHEQLFLGQRISRQRTENYRPWRNHQPGNVQYSGIITQRVYQAK